MPTAVCILIQTDSVFLQACIRGDEDESMLLQTVLFFVVVAALTLINLQMNFK